MASLREVKDRIGSVNNTRKITSAMKMIASSKLHRAQAAITNFLPYSEKLNTILSNLLSADSGYESPYAQQREVKKTAIIAFSSNSSLCGAFNANVIKEANAVYAAQKKLNGDKNIEIYAIGKKVAEAFRKKGIQTVGDYQELLDKPAYLPVADLSYRLIDKYLNKEIDRIVLVYHHFKSTASQVIVRKTLLPFDLDSAKTQAMQQTSGYQADYIFEPSRDEILGALIPKVLVSTLFAALLDSVASEHAARTIAMQTATDNADDLLQELKIQYNKTRQQSITNELLDIIAGAAALE
ncbi:MAG: F0F1 ATP synthase subunit gamma [Prevotella sp.]|jgi:F-type H+-transporting ATPase subunit gamma|nr:F0F1 ATP synthase subunit gamma [Prevotella sp.]